MFQSAVWFEITLILGLILLNGIFATRFLSTVQVGITTIGVLAGAYGGASIAAHLDVWLERFHAFGLDFEIVDMDGRRVDKLLVARAPSG